MRYVMSDIHGMYDKFILMLNRIQFTDQDELYIIGDVIDRGDHSCELLLYILDKKNIHFILGNHEVMMMKYLHYVSRREIYFEEYMEYKQRWYDRTGKKTYRQFMKLSFSHRQQILSFLRTSPYYRIVDSYILCHAGIRVTSPIHSIEEFMKNQSNVDLFSIRNDFYMHKSLEGYQVIFGHTPTRFLRRARGEEDMKDLSIWYDPVFKDKICIDCGAVFVKEGGRLACLRLDDMKEYYV